MMWNWLASSLATGATLVLYDGSPFHPDSDRLFDLVDDCGITLFGVSAKFIDSVARAGLRPVDTHNLGTIRTICSTGSPLSHEGFAHVYADWKADVHLASISGGTDLCGCLVGGQPTGPVHAGQIQGSVLGMDMDVVDGSGLPVGSGVRGELVCRSAFPSQPLGFWDDPDDRRYHATYFDLFPGLWHQGDFAERTLEGGFIIHGRSDATLNPGGVVRGHHRRRHPGRRAPRPDPLRRPDRSLAPACPSGNRGGPRTAPNPIREAGRAGRPGSGQGSRGHQPRGPGQPVGPGPLPEPVRPVPVTYGAR